MLTLKHFLQLTSVVVLAAGEPVLEPQPARQPIAKAVQAMADNIFLIPFFILFLLRNIVCVAFFKFTNGLKRSTLN